MTSVGAYNTVVFGISNPERPPLSPPVGPLAVVLAASLMIGTSHTFASPDSWSFDSFITPNDQETLGTGDLILVYRQVFNSFVQPLPLPVFSATLDSIVAWGRDHVEFVVTDFNTGSNHPKTIRLPLVVVQLSVWQHLQSWFYPFPRTASAPSPSKEQLHK
ncbi:hypothetical protein EV702DRAFT_1046761 [Suillus placidus]|uniref:Uncharacterized protein n=1 Tax=Suillus placidus TaxID=48579 RepID=A0A9P6ZRZ8_9AGAM|nr:hypothetical protein EV702DRAFT_1046761 [Suillus placidus]